LWPDLQRLVAAGLDKLPELSVTDRKTVEEEAADLTMGITSVTEDNRNAACRDQRHLPVQGIPGRLGVTSLI
jgi:hypothetical protein